MKKISVAILAIIIILVGVIFFANRAVAPVKDVSFVNATSTTDVKTPDAKIAPQSPSPLTIGELAFSLPEVDPKNYEAPPKKGYIEGKVFNNYKSATNVEYIPVSNSLSWPAIGYSATLFAAETSESCHKATSTGEKYTGAGGAVFNIFDMGSRSYDNYYETKIYQADVNGNCYNFGIYEEIRIDNSLKDKQIAEGERVRLVLQKLADSVKLK
jgi:hypothetical protein